MFKMLLGVLMIGMADLALMFAIYSCWGFGAFLAFLTFPAILGPMLIRIAGLGNRGSNPAAALGEGVFFLAAYFLFIFPGPISTVAGLLLLIPAVRRFLGRWAIMRLHKAASSGNLSVFTNIGGEGASAGFGGTWGSSVPTAGDVPLGLKRANARVIEPDNLLDAPHDSDDKEPK